MKRSTLSRWMVDITRPTLKPLAASALSRMIDQGLNIAMLGWGAYRLAELPAALDQGQSLSAYLLVTLGVIALAVAVKTVAHYTEHFLGHLVAFHALELLRSHAYEKLAPQAPGIMARSKSGDFLTRLTRDIDRIEVFFAHTFAPAVSVVIIPLALAGWLFAFLGPGVGISYLGCVLLSAVIAPLVGQKSEQQAMSTLMAARSDMAQSVTDTIQGLREVVGYGQEAKRVQLLDHVSSHMEPPARRIAFINALRRSLVRVGQLIVLVAPIVVCYSGVREGSVQAGLVAAAMVMSARSWELVRGVEGFAEGLKESFQAAERVYSLTHGPVLRAGNAAWPAQYDLEFCHVTYHYVGEDGKRFARPAVEDVSLTIPQGSWVCLQGPTGCGKSTLQRLLLRYDDPDSGSITLGGVDIAELPLDTLRSHVHFVTQNATLFHGTIRSNFLLANPAATEKDMWKALEIAEISGEVRGFTRGLDHPIGEGGKGISGGQRQRLCLARALLCAPKVLVLDEFCSQLDPVLDQKVHENLQNRPGDTTVIEITHRDTGLEKADQVITLDAGKIVSRS